MRHQILVFAALGLVGCSTGDRAAAPEKQPPKPAEPAPAEPAKTAAEPAPAVVDAGAAAAKVDEPREGWRKVVLEDEVPLCVFASHLARNEADFLHQAKKQKLVADTEIVFGVFGPGCINEACDAGPTLQCWVDQEGDDTLVVHSKFFGEHKEGSACTENCQPVIAGCATAPLKAGKYTVKYGEQTFPLKIPSTLTKPCFKQK